ncbi:hypothetical protein ACFL6H_07010 [Candidatus Latescibacterota bacterium]
MAKAHVLFKRIIVDSQNLQCFKPSDDHMISRLFFNLEVGGNHYTDMMVEVKQPYGTQYESEPLEVSMLIGPYKGNWSHNYFNDIVENYYRSLIGKEGKLVKISENARNTTFKNCTFELSKEIEFDIPDI